MTKWILAAMLLSAFLLLSACYTYHIFRDPVRHEMESTPDGAFFFTDVSLMRRTDSPTYYRIEIRASDGLEKTDDMRFMHLRDARIMLPSGEAIDLMDGDMKFYLSDLSGTRNFLDVQPECVDGRKIARIDGIAHKDHLYMIFNTDIPKSARSISLHFTLSVEWVNLGVMEFSYVYYFQKQRFTYHLLS